MEGNMPVIRADLEKPMAEDHRAKLQTRLDDCMANDEWAMKIFKKFYLKQGEDIALFIHDKPILKIILKPLFEYFAFRGWKEICRLLERI